MAITMLLETLLTAAVSAGIGAYVALKKRDYCDGHDWEKDRHALASGREKRPLRVRRTYTNKAILEQKQRHRCTLCGEREHRWVEIKKIDKSELR